MAPNLREAGVEVTHTSADILIEVAGGTVRPSADPPAPKRPRKTRGAVRPAAGASSSLTGKGPRSCRGRDGGSDGGARRRRSTLRGRSEQRRPRRRRPTRKLPSLEEIAERLVGDVEGQERRIREMEEAVNKVVTSGSMAKQLGLSLDAFDRFLWRNRSVLPEVRGRAGIIRFWYADDLEQFKQVLETEKRIKGK